MEIVSIYPIAGIKPIKYMTVTTIIKHEHKNAANKVKNLFRIFDSNFFIVQLEISTFPVLFLNLKTFELI